MQAPLPRKTHHRQQRRFVDASVVVADLGAGDAIDQRTAAQPIIALVYDERGLVYNLNLEGSKITRLDR
jgi:lipid-binding SYLF domain-containing protein